MLKMQQDVDRKVDLQDQIVVEDLLAIGMGTQQIEERAFQLIKTQLSALLLTNVKHISSSCSLSVKAKST